MADSDPKQMLEQMAADMKAREDRARAGQPRWDDYRMMGIPYTSTRIWAEIRKKVKKIYKQACGICGHKNRDLPKGSKITAHHINYDDDTMSGVSLDALVAICPECHRSLHFHDGVKLNFGDGMPNDQHLVAQRLSQALTQHAATATVPKQSLTLLAREMTNVRKPRREPGW